MGVSCLLPLFLLASFLPSLWGGFTWENYRSWNRNPVKERAPRPEFIRVVQDILPLPPPPQQTKKRPPEYQLFPIKPLSKTGKFFNMTQVDLLAHFKSFSQLCTCPQLAVPGGNWTCGQNCCYCQFECPIPEDSFTQELLLHRSCPTTSLLDDSQAFQGRRSKVDKRFLSSLATSTYCGDHYHHHHFHSFLRFLCVSATHVGQSVSFYDFNPGWTTSLTLEQHPPHSPNKDEENQGKQEREEGKSSVDYSWQKIMGREQEIQRPKDAPATGLPFLQVTTKKRVTKIKASQLLSPVPREVESEPEDHYTHRNYAFNSSYGVINYTLSSHKHGRDWVLTVHKPIEFLLKDQQVSSSHPACFPDVKLSGEGQGRSLSACKYLIGESGSGSNPRSSSLLQNCTKIREVINITTTILAYSYSNETTFQLSPSPEEEEDREEDDTGESKDERYYFSDYVEDPCTFLPNKGLIIKASYRNSLIGVYSSLSRSASSSSFQPGETFPLTVSFTSVEISEQDFANLPSFWNDFFYGPCPRQHCLRDMGKVGLCDEAAERMSDVDYILWKNIFTYTILPLLPILALFFAHHLSFIIYDFPLFL